MADSFMDNVMHSLMPTPEGQLMREAAPEFVKRLRNDNDDALLKNIDRAQSYLAAATAGTPAEEKWKKVVDKLIDRLGA